MNEVTIAIPTYARTTRLAEAVWCALHQTVACKILILNDCAQQTIQCRDSLVTVINTIPYPYLGAKRNALLAHIDTEWTCWLDDDDWLFPWYVEDLLTEAKKVTHTYNMIQPKNLWLVHGGYDGNKNLVWEPNAMAVMPCLVKTKEAQGCFPQDTDSGEDQVFRAKMKVHKFTPKDGGYLYRWANGSHHISGSGGANAGSVLRQEAMSRIYRGVEPHGSIVLTPSMDLSWFQSAPKHLLERAGWA